MSHGRRIELVTLSQAAPFRREYQRHYN
jgi:hypothetical protein